MEKENKIKKHFWREYKESNEIEQWKLLQKLTGCERDKMGFLKYMTLTLFKSYIDDAIEFA